MSERFFVNTRISGDQVALDGPEAHHLAHVMRAAPGDRVTLFDGSGCEFEAEVTSIQKSSAKLTLIEKREVNRESATQLTLAVALPKGDRQQWLVEKAVELGVTAIIPLIAERSVAKPVASAILRLQRFVIEASKQCGRNRLLEIAEPRTWHEFVANSPAADLRLIAHPGGKPLSTLHIQNSESRIRSSILAAVGPEGGFSDAEIQGAINVNWTDVDLGPRILRVETACIAIASWALLGSAREINLNGS